MELLSKLSIKTCKAAPQLEFVNEDGKQVPRAKGEQNLLRITGIAVSKKLVTTDYGTSIQLQGTFQGTNLLSGEVFRSTKCFLPEIAAGLVGGALNEDIQELQFAFDIGCRPSKVPCGYEYTVTPLIDITENDPLAMLTAKLEKEKPLQIAGPAEAVPKETAKKTKK